VSKIILREEISKYDDEDIRNGKSIYADLDEI